MTPLKPKYAQVSDGCWESPTAVQVGLSWSRGPADVGHCLEGFYAHFRHRVVPLFFFFSNLYKGKAHACVGNYGVCTAQRFSAQRAAYERAPCGECVFFWQMSFVLTVCVSHVRLMCVSVCQEKRASSLGLNLFCWISSLQASVPYCRQRLLEMFLIRLYRHGTQGDDTTLYYP